MPYSAEELAELPINLHYRDYAGTRRLNSNRWMEDFKGLSKEKEL